MKISIFGMGWVGLVLAAGLAAKGHQIMGVDVDERKITNLRKGNVPIFEPNLDELVELGLKRKRLHFTADAMQAVEFSDILYIAVGTPSKKDGSVLMAYVRSVADVIAKHMKEYKIIVTKSTVPIGTSKMICKIIAKKYKGEFEMVSNPEFLREGTAVMDFLEPDRVVLGVENKKGKAAKRMAKLFSFGKSQIFITDNESAEAIKYASNSFLANQISFINMVSNICEKTGANVDEVAAGMKLDKRIGQSAYFNAGVGYGGSCFTKDVQAFIKIAEKAGAENSLLKDIEKVNRIQRHLVVKKAKKFLGNLRGKKIALWGLAFKPDSDDLRDAPSIDIIKDFKKAGAKVSVFDPEVDRSYKNAFPKISFASDPLSCAREADCLILVTHWKDFKKVNLKSLKRAMKRHFFIDGRNMFKRDKMEKIGFKYDGFGV